MSATVTTSTTRNQAMCPTGALWEYKDGCDVLWQLGVAVAAYGPEEGRKGLKSGTCRAEMCWPPYFKFLPASKIRALILSEPLTMAPSLDEILSAYLGMMCGYRPERLLPHGRQPFFPPREYRREIQALERLGYARFHRGAVLWTDRIAPAMRAAYIWSDDGELENPEVLS